MIVAMLVSWEVIWKKSPALSLIGIFFEGLVVSLSLLSRGVLIFHIVPQVWALFENRFKEIRINARKAFLIGGGLVVSLVLAIATTNLARALLYPDSQKPVSQNQVRLIRLEAVQGDIHAIRGQIAVGNTQEKAHLEDLEKEEKDLLEKLSQPVTESDRVSASTANVSMKNLAEKVHFDLLKSVYGLIADRFIGLEGVMAVYAYPSKSMEYFGEALTEKRVLGKVSSFQYVSKSTYRFVDTNIWQFASLPGPVAFLFLSGNLWVVFFGMMILTTAVLGVEYLIFRYVGNPFLCSLIGFCMANSVAQFGLTPRQEIPFFFMIFLTLSLLGLFYSIHRKKSPTRVWPKGRDRRDIKLVFRGSK